MRSTGSTPPLCRSPADGSGRHPRSLATTWETAKWPLETHHGRQATTCRPSRGRRGAQPDADARRSPLQSGSGAPAFMVDRRLVNSFSGSTTSGFAESLALFTRSHPERLSSVISFQDNPALRALVTSTDSCKEGQAASCWAATATQAKRSPAPRRAKASRPVPSFGTRRPCYRVTATAYNRAPSGTLKLLPLPK
jgi:hypothetical protein